MFPVDLLSTAFKTCADVSVLLMCVFCCMCVLNREMVPQGMLFLVYRKALSQPLAVAVALNHHRAILTPSFYNTLCPKKTLTIVILSDRWMGLEGAWRFVCVWIQARLKQYWRNLWVCHTGRGLKLNQRGKQTPATQLDFSKTVYSPKNLTESGGGEEEGGMQLQSGKGGETEGEEAERER